MIKETTSTLNSLRFQKQILFQIDIIQIFSYYNKSQVV